MERTVIVANKSQKPISREEKEKIAQKRNNAYRAPVKPQRKAQADDSTTRVSKDKIRNSSNRPNTNDNKATKRISKAEQSKLLNDLIKEENAKQEHKYQTSEISYEQETKKLDNKREAKITIVPAAQNIPIPWYRRLKRNGPNKKYRLKGFANKNYAYKVRKHKKSRNRWMNIIFWILLIFLLLVVFLKLNPVSYFKEFQEMVGY